MRLSQKQRNNCPSLDTAAGKWYNIFRHNAALGDFGGGTMAKRDDKRKDNNKLERAIMRNWIICGASLAAIIALYMMSKG